MKINPNSKVLTELRISSPRFKVNLSHNFDIKLLSSSHHKMQMMADSSLDRASAMKEYCEGVIGNVKSNSRISYSQLMLQTFSKLPNLN
jgi:hypothetical protein